jgi:hypothetical protein
MNTRIFARVAAIATLVSLASAAHADASAPSQLPPIPPASSPTTTVWIPPAAPPAQTTAVPASSTIVTVSTETSGVPAQHPAQADRTQWEPADQDHLLHQKVLHGFRLGYAYVANYDKPVDSLGGKSLKDRIDMKTPHSFLLGYEGMVRMVGHSWLNVILVGNVMLAGLEQSKFYPTANGLLGFEIDNSFQVGVGASLTPLKGQEGHAIIAAGWTPRVGSFYVPVHAFLIPDVDGLHRTGMTTGVTW